MKDKQAIPIPFISVISEYKMENVSNVYVLVGLWNILPYLFQIMSAGDKMLSNHNWKPYFKMKLEAK